MRSFAARYPGSTDLKQRTVAATAREQMAIYSGGFSPKCRRISISLTVRARSSVRPTAKLPSSTFAGPPSFAVPDHPCILPCAFPHEEARRRGLFFHFLTFSPISTSRRMASGRVKNR